MTLTPRQERAHLDDLARVCRRTLRAIRKGGPAERVFRDHQRDFMDALDEMAFEPDTALTRGRRPDPRRRRGP